VLNSNDSQADTEALMNYGFGNYRRLILAVQEQPVESVDVPGGVEKLQVVPSERLHVSVKAGQQDTARAEIELADLRAPIRKGDKVGTITAYVGERRIASVDLQAGNDVDESFTSAAWPWVRGIGLLVVLSAGVACGRATAKGNGRGRSRFS
jgi:D-alanyl-D-alanine carboxypeptidase (penicillin-binding protein 5/6)